MKLNVPILSQRDDRWASQRLGTVDGTTIGSHGCIVTCMTMLAQYYGHQVLPNEMDDWLTANQGYVQGNLYRNDAFGREFTDCKFNNIVFCTNIPAPLDQIDAALNAGHPSVIMVDFDHDPSDGIQTHFCVIVGKTETGSYIINDPWFGDEVFIEARYGQPASAIQQINFFSGPTTQPAPTTYKGIDLTNIDSVKVCVDAWYDVSHGVYVKKTDFDALNEKANGLQDRVDSLNAGTNTLNNQKNTLTAQVANLTSQLTECQLSLKNAQNQPAIPSDPITPTPVAKPPSNPFLEWLRRLFGG